jgi:hypothetical protein
VKIVCSICKYKIACKMQLIPLERVYKMVKHSGDKNCKEVEVKSSG